eukprot:tig00020710_g13313.t1
MRSLLALLALLAFCAAFACAQEQPQSGSQRQPLIFDPGVLDQVNGDRIQVWLPSADVLELGDTDGIAGFFDTIRDPWGRISEALVNALFLRYDPASNSLSEVSGKRVEPPQRDNGLFAISNMVGSSTALRALDLEDDQKYFQDLINFLRSNMGYQSGSDLWGFPFDWRTSNGLPEKVEALHRLVQQARGALYIAEFVTLLIACTL